MSRRNRLTALVRMLVAAAVLASCQDSVPYFHYERIDAAGWEKGEHVVFDVGAVRGGRYAEELGLRTTDLYPFMSISIIVSQQATPSGFSRTDTLSPRLIDEDGIVLGRGTSHYQYVMPLPSVVLADGDTLRVSVRHNMRRELLPGIAGVGLRLSRADSAAGGSSGSRQVAAGVDAQEDEEQEGESPQR